LKTPIGGAFETQDDAGVHRLGPMQTIEFPMKRHSENETLDYIIVGVGAAGGVLLQRLDSRCWGSKLAHSGTPSAIG
jgi:hypothetical protein